MVAIPPPLSDPECSCSAPSPSFTPRLSSLSNSDLDALESLYWSLIGLQVLFPIVDGQLVVPTYAEIQAAFAPCACWLCLTPRQKRELMIAKMLNLATGQAGCPDASQIRQTIRAIRAKMTPSQIQASIDCGRYAAIETYNCSVILL